MEVKTSDIKAKARQAFYALEFNGVSIMDIIIHNDGVQTKAEEYGIPMVIDGIELCVKNAPTCKNWYSQKTKSGFTDAYTDEDMYNEAKEFQRKQAAKAEREAKKAEKLAKLKERTTPKAEE